MTLDQVQAPALREFFRQCFPAPSTWSFIGRDFRGTLLFYVKLKPHWGVEYQTIPEHSRIIGIPPAVFWEGRPDPNTGIKLYIWAAR